MLETMGVDRLLSVDLHSGQIQGFFSNRCTTDNLPGVKVGALFFSEMDGLRGPVVLAASSGSVARAKV